MMSLRNGGRAAVVLPDNVRGKEEPAGAASRVAYGLGNFRAGTVNHRLDERARCEILTCSALFVLTVAFQYAFVDCTLHVTFEKPVLFINHCDDLFQIYRLVNLILGFCEDCADKIILTTQKIERFFILL